LIFRLWNFSTPSRASRTTIRLIPSAARKRDLHEGGGSTEARPLRPIGLVGPRQVAGHRPGSRYSPYP
jgi:hypothetical protein